MADPSDAPLDQAEQDELPRLRSIYFYLTEGCNLACRHCWLGPPHDPDGRTHPVLPVELFETAIQEAKPLGLTGIKLTGGEPLLHPEIKAILQITQREELGLTIETNGVLCTPDLAAEIAKSAKKPVVSVSIDGSDAETHEWMRGVRGCFEATVQGVRNLVAVDIRPQIIVSVVRRNIGQVESVIRMAEDLGASSVKFNLVQPTERGEAMHRTEENLSVEELVRLGERVERELSQQAKIKLVYSHPLAFRPLSRLSREGLGCGHGCAIHNIIGVIATGHYALCGIGDNVPDLVFGRVGHDPLERVWRDTLILNEIRAGLADRLEGVCSRCMMRQVCFGSCVAQNYYRTGSLFSSFWFCEQAEKTDAFPETRLEATA